MKIKIASLLIYLVTLPFPLLLTYKILETIHATELMWFLYWLLIPLGIVAAILTKLAEWEED